MTALLLAACAECPTDTGSIDFATSDVDSGASGPSRWMAVAVGHDQACGITTVGEIRCWGQASPDTSGNTIDYIGEYTPRGQFSAITMTDDYSNYMTEPVCALTAAGATARCWGDYELAVDAAMTDYRGTATYACGLRRDSRRLECLAVHDRDRTLPNFSSLPSVDRFRMHESRIAAVKADGSLVEAHEGSLRDDPRAPTPDGPWRVVEPYGYGFCGVRATGALDCWAYFEDDEPTELDAVPEGTFTDVCVGAFACALGSDSHVTCWGERSAPAPDRSFTAIDCGYDSACGVTTEQEIECWGGCSEGKCDVPE